MIIVSKTNLHDIYSQSLMKKIFPHLIYLNLILNKSNIFIYIYCGKSCAVFCLFRENNRKS